VTRVARIDDLPLINEGHAWRAVRQPLGINAFGVNAFTADEDTEVIEDHDETGGNAAGHEELYVVVRGHARFTVDGEDIDAPAGTLVFVDDPASRRGAHATADGTIVLVVGGRAGEVYAPSPWEVSSYAAYLATHGEPERALALAREVVEAHPDNPAAFYNAACTESLAGERDAALEHLARAVELEPKAVEWAAGDSDLDAIRDDPRFPAGP
jgi:tetratricopeptide (TPR) repeat protein